MIKRLLVAVMVAVGLFAGGAGTGFADPDFGPGNSSKGPHDSGAICHPPGQTSDLPACK
jgi:hypothetical protein